MKLVIALLCCGFATLTFAQSPAPAKSKSKPEPTTADPTKIFDVGKQILELSKPTAQPKPQAVAPAKSKAAPRADRLELEATTVTGNRELPKVLYIVPWKKAEIGDLPAQPFNTLLDEVLAPVDRDVFKREVKYFQTVTGADAAAPNPGAAQ